MTSITFRVDEELKARLDGLVASMGLNESRVLRDAVEEKMAELELTERVLVRMKTKHDTMSHAQLKKELGFSD